MNEQTKINAKIDRHEENKMNQSINVRIENNIIYFLFYKRNSARIGICLPWISNKFLPLFVTQCIRLYTYVFLLVKLKGC